MTESLWSPTPIGETFGAIQKAVAGYVLMPTDDEVLDCAAQGIRRAIDRMNTRNWNWALTYSTITFVAGTQEYGLDQAFKAPRNFALRDSATTDVGRLSYLPWGSFLKECQWEGTGNPTYYSANNVNYFGVIRLDVAPSASFVATYPTGRLWFHRRVQYPSATGTSLDVPSEAVAYIQAAAEGYTADRYAVTKARDAYMRSERMMMDLIRDDCHGQQTDWE